jgi:hypothetical protein
VKASYWDLSKLVLRRVLRSAGLPHRTFQNLRATCSSLLKQWGVAPEYVRAVIGHETDAVARGPPRLHDLSGPGEAAARRDPHGPLRPDGYRARIGRAARYWRARCEHSPGSRRARASRWPGGCGVGDHRGQNSAISRTYSPQSPLTRKKST